VIFQQNLVILPQNISITPLAQECKQGSFCSIFWNLSKYYTLEISVLGEQGLLVTHKTSIHRYQAHGFHFKIIHLLPQNDQ
jgi:hypothetical protein